MARLIIENGEDSGMVYSVTDEPVVLGRSSDCAIQLLDRRISRQHARVFSTDGGFELEDLQSRNGVAVNHQVVDGRIRLRNGDIIALGGIELLFELEPDELGDSSAQAGRVRLESGMSHQLQAEKPVGVDTAPLVAQLPLRREAVSDPEERLRVLYQVSDALRGEVDTQALLNKLMRLIWRVMAPDRGIILLFQENDNTKLTPVVVKTQTANDKDIVISQQVIDKSIRDKSAILMADGPQNSEFAHSESIIRGNILSIICAPLVAHGRPFGVVYIDTQLGSSMHPHLFSTDDLELMSGITNQAALALDNARLYEETLKHQRLERELEIARDIQEQLLPTNYPSIFGLQVAALCKPARQVGGDYYDFFDVGDHCTALVIGDASGKGVPAAISVAMARTAVRARIRTQREYNLGTVISGLNKAFYRDRLRDNYVTACVLLYDEQTHKVTYTNAGHVPPLLFRANGEIEKLTVGGPLFAAIDEAEYGHETVDLSPGDVLVMYSDGLTDTHSLAGELYGEERLIQTIRHALHLSASKICDYIDESIVRFRETREPFDDLTIVILKVTATGGELNQTEFDE